MHLASILRILGLLLMLFSLTLLPPILVEEWYRDGSLSAFVWSVLAIIGIGIIIWFPFRRQRKDLRSRDGFLVVVLFWSVLCLVGALPFYLSPDPNISFTDAFFESVSGITTTGSTVLSGLDDLPHSILYYRQQLQFLGGIGIIILAVAILPMLGIGGMQLFRAEMTGPVKDNKLTPRIAHTAKAIWLIYVTMTVVCGFAYWLGGMEPFDAIAYSFSTVSTGGYATHDASMGYFDNPLLKFIAVIFMFLSAVSFSLHFTAIRSKKIGIYNRDPELRMFLKIMLASFLAIWLGFVIYGQPIGDDVLLDSIFQAVSLCTTTGLVTTDFSLWPSFIPLMLLFCGVIGGCAGSTTGGLKVVRILLLLKQGTREIYRLVHPHSHSSIKLGSMPVSSRVIEAIWGFLAIYFAIFSFFLLSLLLTEMDFLTAYTALIATFSNIGPGLGHVASNFSALSDLSKWILSFAMLVGRLEIFTVLVLFSPVFWRS
jgi:trk/ktr system potassium uptake protein